MLSKRDGLRCGVARVRFGRPEVVFEGSQVGIGIGFEMIRRRSGDGEDDRLAAGEELREKIEETVEALLTLLSLLLRSSFDLMEEGRWIMLGRWKCILKDLW